MKIERCPSMVVVHEEKERFASMLPFMPVIR